MAGGLPGLGSSMIRGPYAGWQLGQALGPARNVHEWPPGLARRGTRTGEVAKAVEPTAPATTYPFYGKRLIAVCAARAPTGLERGGDWSAGPAGGRAARGERSEPP